MAQIAAHSKSRHRRIIARPRLTRLLDESAARVRILIAPAGYGKTTLAEQWAGAPDRRAGWYSCRESSADVAVLCVGLAQAASAVLPACDVRIRERIRSTRNPPAEVEMLAEILAEDLRGWPADSWLVIDDYHLLGRLPEAERFVQLLVEHAPVNLLLTTRQRPSWVSRRLLLYGDVLELTRAQLAMDTDEVDALVEECASPHAAEMLALAGGLPAVLGFALVGGARTLPDGSIDPEEAYEYFAEEVFRHLPETVQIDLAVLATAPRIDDELAVALLGAERAHTVLAESVAVSILDKHGARLDFHPLARAFVAAHAHPDAGARREEAFDICFRTYRSRRDWDSAFELIERAGEPRHLDEIVPEALDALLESGRLATIEEWVRHASTRGETSPVVKLAAAELALRRGQFAVAESMIHGALRGLDAQTDLEFRALKVAGQVAHLAAREADGLEFYSRAEAAAVDEFSRREARWGRLVTLTALEQHEARDLLDEMARETRADEPIEQVRLAGKRISVALHFGDAPDLWSARQVAQLLELVGDPLVRCSFRSVFSYALGLNAEYESALSIADELVSDATAHRVDFGLTYGFAGMARAFAGLKRYEESYAALERSLRAARDCTDVEGEQNVYAIRLRVLLQEQRLADACSLEPPDVSRTLAGLRGEVLVSRGLALACIGRSQEAIELAEEASEMTRFLDVVVLAAAVRAVVDVRAGSDNAFAAARSLLEIATGRRALDLLATAYRACPEVLRLLLASPTTSESALFAASRAGDMGLANRLGGSPESIFDARTLLSPREREVYSLLREGMADKEIARLLFISPGTAKSHVHRILEKLGYRSRRALMLDAARAGQAAPTATLPSVSESGS